MVKNPIAMRETWVQSLGWEDLLEDSLATPSSIPAWRIPQTEGLGGLQCLGSQRAGHDCVIKLTAQERKVGPNRGSAHLLGFLTVGGGESTNGNLQGSFH